MPNRPLLHPKITTPMQLMGWHKTHLIRPTEKHMKKLMSCLLIVIPVLLAGCEEDDDPIDKTVLCSQLANALVVNDKQAVETYINKFLNAQQAGIGLHQSFDDLKEEIEACPSMQVTGSCFGCIETNPPQSEIMIATTANNQIVNKTIDLVQRDNKLIFINLHD
jgi:hypothetical protein